MAGESTARRIAGQSSSCTPKTCGVAGACGVAGGGVASSGSTGSTGSKGSGRFNSTPPRSECQFAEPLGLSTDSDDVAVLERARRGQRFAVDEGLIGGAS